MGNEFYRRGELAEAKAHYLRAIELYPGYLDALNNLGIVLKATGELKKAEKIYGWLLEANTEDPVLHYDMGLLMVQQKKYNEALDVFGRAVKLRPDDPAVYNQIGLIFIRLGNRTGACRFFNLALQVQGDFSPAKKNKASFCKEGS